MSLGSTQPLTEINTRHTSWEVNAAGGFMAEYLTTFMCRMSETLGVSTSSRPKILLWSLKLQIRSVNEKLSLLN
jgi:hypothetical protein